MAKRRKRAEVIPVVQPGYDSFLSGLSDLLEQSRRSAARAVNSLMTAAYWEIGRRIVEFEQGGKARAEYGEALLQQLADDLTAKHGRGFSARNLRQMRAFYLSWQVRRTPAGFFEARAIPGSQNSGNPESQNSGIWQTPSAKFPSDSIDLDPRSTKRTQKEQATAPEPVVSPLPTPEFTSLFGAFALPWSHYVRLMAVEKPHARAFYEAEAVRGGWSVRQLARQIGSQFFERTSASKRQEAMRTAGQRPRLEDAVSARDEIRDPYLLEFLDLKDEYSEAELEEAIIRHLESFLLELGVGFAFIARQKRIRVGNEWYRIDLLLYHRGLRCLVVIDLKTGPFTHADAGQMNLYLNYAREHLTLSDEVAPVGVILCSDKDDAVVKYATGGINAQVFASKYLTKLPDEETLRQEILATQRALESSPR